MIVLLSHSKCLGLDFPGGPVATKTLHFHYRRHEFDPGQGSSTCCAVQPENGGEGGGVLV